jgi:LPXTG-motif cell wall-anchored protein
MFKLRVAAAATVIALLGAFASVGSANAATGGVGTTETSTSLVDVALGNAGSLLRLRVLGDDAKATVDPGVGPVSAFSQLFALKATSSVLPVLNNLTIPSPPLESRTPGGNSNVTGPVINLTNALPTLPILGTAIASGSIAPVNLTSGITDGVAKSGLGANLANVGLVGNLLSVDAVKSTMGATAGASSADGLRGLEVGAISVLNLGALLRGLGIDPTTLTIPVVSGLVESLGLGIPGLEGDATLNGLVTQITDAIDDLLAGSGTFGELTAPVQGVLNGLGLPIASGGVIPSTTTVTDLLPVALPELQDLLTGLLDTVLGALDGIELLNIDGLKLGTVTKAVTSTGDSKADVVGTLGAIKVGNLPLTGALDLNGVLSTATNLVGTIQNTLDGVLAPLGLNGIISVKLFDKAASNGVSSASGYTRALAGITGVSIGINPPADILDIVGDLAGGTGSIGSILGANNGDAAIPVVGGLMGSLNGVSGIPAVGNVVGALLGGASIKVASVATGSNFTAPGATPNGVTPVTQLPRTGADTTVFLVIGLLMVGGVIVARRYIPVRASIEK